MSKHNGRFYSDGLQFECTQCGKCCTGAPGFVYLSDFDEARISEFLNVHEQSFLREYTRTVTIFGERRRSLTERPNYDCVFWKKTCTIYPVRPYQCRSYPFWKRNLVSNREWLKVGSKCPGIDRGRLHSAEEIERCITCTPVYKLDGIRKEDR
jgi:Fe-S-cluster containining protein